MRKAPHQEQEIGPSPARDRGYTAAISPLPCMPPAHGIVWTQEPLFNDL